MKRDHGATFFGKHSAVVGVLLICALAPTTATSDHEPVGAATPRELVLKLRDAYEDGDPDAAEALVDQSTAMGRLLATIQGKTLVAATAYEELMELARAKFGAAETSQIASNFGLDRNSAFAGAVEDLKIKIKGGKATVRRPGKRKKLTLIRKEGRWFLDAEAIMGKKTTEELENESPEEREKTFRQTAMFMDCLIEVFRDHSVIDDCATIEELEEKLDKRLTGAILKVMGEIIEE